MSVSWAHREGTLVVAVDLQVLIVLLLPIADILVGAFHHDRTSRKLASKDGDKDFIFTST
jgi:hypothetical protein